MSVSGGGVSVTRVRGENRFYNPPAVRQRQLEEQKRQLEQEKRQKHLEKEKDRQKEKDQRALLGSKASSSSVESDDCASSFCSLSTRGGTSTDANVTNLDRFLEYTTPLVPAQCFPKDYSQLISNCQSRLCWRMGCTEKQSSVSGWRTREPELHPYFVLGDLWESFEQWSVYGAGVPLLLNGTESVVQYYVPSLSGIQLYIDPSKASSRLSKCGNDSNADSSRETSSDNCSDYGAERGFNKVAHGSLGRQNVDGFLNNNKLVEGSSSDESETSNSTGHLLFEYFEQEPPHTREPLADKASFLASQFPELQTYRSSDLSSSSWISVAWYPIYRIPTGQTLQNLDACFLTFHSLSSQIAISDWRHSNGARPEAHDANPKLSLPIFGLAYYKFKVPFWVSNGVCECQKANSLLRAADNWLRLLQVNHPDYIFFTSRNTPRR